MDGATIRAIGARSRLSQGSMLDEAERAVVRMIQRRLKKIA
jgi:hypothetical protein